MPYNLTILFVGRFVLFLVLLCCFIAFLVFFLHFFPFISIFHIIFCILQSSMHKCLWMYHFIFERCAKTKWRYIDSFKLFNQPTTDSHIQMIPIYLLFIYIQILDVVVVIIAMFVSVCFSLLFFLCQVAKVNVVLFKIGRDHINDNIKRWILSFDSNSNYRIWELISRRFMRINLWKKPNPFRLNLFSIIWKIFGWYFKEGRGCHNVDYSLSIQIVLIVLVLNICQLNHFVIQCLRRYNGKFLDFWIQKKKIRHELNQQSIRTTNHYHCV